MWLVAQQEFVGRGKSTAYLISTAFMIIALFLATVAPTWFERSAEVEPVHVLLLDRTGQVAAPLQAALADADTQGTAPVTLTGVTDAAAATEQARKEDKAFLLVEGAFPDAVQAQYVARSPRLLDQSGAVLGALEGIVRAARIEAAGLDPGLAGELLRPVQTEVAQLTAAGGQRDEQAYRQNFFLAFGIVFVLYMVLIINSQFMFQGVLEEKVSRVMEVMAATVGPRHMLAGKVLGLGALGLIQFLAMLIAWGTGTFVLGGGDAAQSLTAYVIGTTLLFLVLGYIVSAALMAAAAATISRLEDQQAALMPVITLLAIPFMLLPAVMNDPHSAFATVLSLIPFFSQSIMVFRILMGDVPLWQVFTALALMALTAVLAVRAAGRIYRAAMLSYSGRPSLGQLWAYLRAN